jgi:hypothetical protein
MALADSADCPILRLFVPLISGIGARRVAAIMAQRSRRGQVDGAPGTQKAQASAAAVAWLRQADAAAGGPSWHDTCDTAHACPIAGNMGMPERPMHGAGRRSRSAAAARRRANPSRCDPGQPPLEFARLA